MSILTITSAFIQMQKVQLLSWLNKSNRTNKFIT